MKFSSHGTYIRPNSVVAMAAMPVVLVCGNELPHAQAEHEQDEEAGFKIVHARGRTVDAQLAVQVQRTFPPSAARRRPGRTI